MIQLFGLAILSALGIAIVFMVMAMTGGLESRTKSDLGIGPSRNAASNEDGINVPSYFEPVIVLGSPSSMEEN